MTFNDFFPTLLIKYSLLHHQDLTLAQTELLICTDVGKYESVGVGRVCISNNIYKSSVCDILCTVTVSKSTARSLDLNALLLVTL